MKRILTAAVLALFCTSLVACHASVDTADDGSGSHYEKKTTTNDDGTRTTKTETKKTTSSY
jgi:hypothetical protein